MAEWVYVLVIVCVVLSYLTMGIYYLWIFLIALFPKIQRWKEIEYDEDMEIHFFLVIPCLNEAEIIASTVANVLKIGMKNLRVIVVDDDSEDDTVQNLMEAFGSVILPIDNGAPFSIAFNFPLIICLRRGDK